MSTPVLSYGQYILLLVWRPFNLIAFCLFQVLSYWYLLMIWYQVWNWSFGSILSEKVLERTWAEILKKSSEEETIDYKRFASQVLSNMQHVSSNADWDKRQKTKRNMIQIHKHNHYVQKYKNIQKQKFKYHRQHWCFFWNLNWFPLFVLF